MAIKFYNTVSKQTIVADSEEHIAALYNSSDKTVNASQGQDMGWRLDPILAAELKRAIANPEVLRKIAIENNLSIQDIKEHQVLSYITRGVSMENAPEPRPEDFEDDYRKLVAEAEAKLNAKEKAETSKK